MMEFTVEVPGLPLSVNKAYRGRRFKTKELTSYKAFVGSHMGNMHTPVGKLSVEVDLISDDWMCKNGNVKKRDIDNCLKTLLDSIFSCLDTDDSYIWDLKVRKVDGPIQKTVVRIYELELQ